VKQVILTKTELAVISGGLTQFLQPLDISVNKSFEPNIRRLWATLIADEAKASLTKGFNHWRADLVLMKLTQDFVIL